MTTLLNWLVLFAFSAAAIFVARWITQQAFSRWEKPKTGVSFAFLYSITLATICGISFVAVSVLYYEILYQETFLQLVGLPGAAKFLLMFSGVWYASLYAFKLKDGDKA